MLKSTVKLLPFLFLVLFTVNSCKKKNDNKSKTQLITERDWKAVKIEEKDNSLPWEDQLAGEPVCITDDRYVFRVNNTYEINEGPTKCNISDDQIYDTGAWSLGDNETKFIWLFGLAFTIEQLDENTLIISYTQTTGSDVQRIKFTFAH
jgi:hypothetical protein